MTPATLLTQHRDCADRNARKAQGDMHPQDYRQKEGVGRRNFDTRHDRRFSDRHGATPSFSFIIDSADEDGRLTANAPAPQTMQSMQQPIRTAA